MKYEIFEAMGAWYFREMRPETSFPHPWVHGPYMNESTAAEMAQWHRNEQIREGLRDLIETFSPFEVAAQWEMVMMQELSTPPADENQPFFGNPTCGRCETPIRESPHWVCHDGDVGWTPYHQGCAHAAVSVSDDCRFRRREPRADACTMTYARACNDVHCPVHGTNADEQ